MTSHNLGSFYPFTIRAQFLLTSVAAFFPGFCKIQFNNLQALRKNTTQTFAAKILNDFFQCPLAAKAMAKRESPLKTTTKWNSLFVTLFSQTPGMALKHVTVGLCWTHEMCIFSCLRIRSLLRGFGRSLWCGSHWCASRCDSQPSGPPKSNSFSRNS